MTLLRTLMAKGGMNFAHLGGIKAGKPRSDDADKKDDDKDDDADKGKDAKADDTDPPKKDDDKDEGGKDAKAGKDDSGKGGGEDDDADKDKGAKGSKASTDDADADDDDEEEMHGKSAAASARRRERARCSAIFASRAAARNPVLAANLAFNSNMTRKNAVAMLESTPAPQAAAPQNASRAANNPRVDPPGAPEQNAHASLMSSWDAARARNKSQGG